MDFIKSKLGYLFTPNPGPACDFYPHLAVLIAILIIGSIAFSFLYKKKKRHDFAFKRLFKKTSNRFTIIGIILILLTASRYENIPYFSMRIWLYLALLTLLYFLYKYIKILKVDYPREKKNVQANTHKKDVAKKENTYLPNKK